MATFPRRSDGEVLTAAQLNSYLDEIEQTEAEVAAHVGNVANPHSVTKAQVGLGSVDNTSDLAKPISTATQTALNGKANTAHTHATTDMSATGTRSSATYLRGDNVWSTPTNTTYAVMTQAEAEAGTATTARTMSAARLKDTIGFHPPAPHTHPTMDSAIAVLRTDVDNNSADIAAAQGRVFYVDVIEDYPTALAAAKAKGGGVIQFSAGNFSITTPLTTGSTSTEYVRGITFRGMGKWATTLRVAHATIDIFILSQYDEMITIEDMAITAAFNQSRTAGNAIYVNGAHTVNLRNLRLGSTYNLITVNNNASQVYIDMVTYYTEPGTTGFLNRGLFLQTCTVVHVHRMIGSLGNGKVANDAMFRVDSNVDTAIFVECNDASGGLGGLTNVFKFTHSLGSGAFAPRIIRLTRCFAESGAGYTGYDVQNATDVSIVDCYAATCGMGFRVIGGKDIRISYSVAYNCMQHGFDLSGASHLDVSHCMSCDNSQEVTNTYAGFSISPTAGMVYFSITNCRAGDWYLNSTKKQAYGIMVWGGSVPHYRVTDNYGKGNVTSQIVDNGTATVSKVVRDNIAA